MDHSPSDAVETFMNITGATQEVALQRLQAHNGDLNAAINSFFNEGENSVLPRQSEEANMADWMEEDAPVQIHPLQPLIPPTQPVPTPPTWGVFNTGSQMVPGEGLQGASAPPFPARGSTPIVSHTREVREIPIDWKDEDTITRPHSGPVIQEVPPSEFPQLPSESHGRIIVDEDDEDIPSTASSNFRPGWEAPGMPSFVSRIFAGDNPDRDPNVSAPLVNEVPALATDDGNDIEEEMLRAAIEASKKEAEAASRRQRSEYPEVMLGTGASEGGMQTEDDDLARAVSLSLKTAEQEKALRERQGLKGVLEEGFMQEEEEDGNLATGDIKRLGLLKRRGSTSAIDNARPDAVVPNRVLLSNDTNLRKLGSGTIAAPSSPPDDVEELEEKPLLRRRSGRRLGSAVGQPAAGSTATGESFHAPPQESNVDASVPAGDLIPNAPPQRNGDILQTDEWGGISSEEQEEAMMLEAAMFGTIPEDAASRFRFPIGGSAPNDSGALLSGDIGPQGFPRPIPQPPSPSVVAQRLLREQQDDEYHASLEADRQKELKAYKEEQRRLEEELQRQQAEEELERHLATKRASLPAEPAIEDDSAVTILVRMPDGNRQGRRFHKSDRLQTLFDFIDVGGGLKPGSYRLVRQYPRRTFTNEEHGVSFNDLGLSSKQEALFLELI